MNISGLFMTGFRSSFCSGNWPPVRMHKADTILASRTPAKGSWRPWTSTSTSRGGKRLPTNAIDGDAIYPQGWNEKSRNEGLSPGRNILDEKKRSIQHHWGDVIICIRCKQDCQSSVGLYRFCNAIRCNTLGTDPRSLEADGCHIYIYFSVYSLSLETLNKITKFEVLYVLTWYRLQSLSHRLTCFPWGFSINIYIPIGLMYSPV